MPASRLFLLALISLLTACTNIEGMYKPACIAYEGDTIELFDGSFAWRRFTDERRVDADGELIDPFPDFPKKGSYTLDNAVLELSMNDGGDYATFYPLQLKSDYYLLRQAEYDAYLANDKVPDCALKRNAGRTDLSGNTAN